MDEHRKLNLPGQIKWAEIVTIALVIVYSPTANGDQPKKSIPAAAPDPGTKVAKASSPWNHVEAPEELKNGIEFKKPPKGTRFSFNLMDADINELVKIIGNITGKAFIMGGKTPAIKATVYAPNKITAAEAYQVFLSVLAVNGLGVIPAGRYLKIAPLKNAASQNVPIVKNRSVPKGDQIVTRLHSPKHVAVGDVADLLERFKSPNGDIAVYAPTNLLIITDHGYSIRKLLKILENIDVEGTGTQIWIEPINHADASEISTRITDIFEATNQATKAGRSSARTKLAKKKSKNKRKEPLSQSDQTADDTISKIIPDERTNCLIIIASENAYYKILEIVKRLDVPIAGEGTLHLLKLKHADAAELAKTLNNLTKGGRSKTKGARGSGDSTLFEGEVHISPDEATNSLAVVATFRDFVSLKQLVSELDVVQQQVFVEVVILEVGLDTDLDRGLGFHAGGAKNSNDGQTMIYGSSQPVASVGSMGLTSSMLSGLAVGIQGPELEGLSERLGFSVPSFGVTLHALQANTDVNILSTPYILATNNEEAIIVVGKNVPIQQGISSMGAIMSQAAQNGVDIPGGSNFSSIGRQNVGLTLKIKPQINDGEQVKLDVDIEVSDVVSVDPTTGPDIAQKSTTTSSIVSDQRTIVIGGLITDTEVTTTNKVPVLGDIPILGFLFRHKKTVAKKNNLLIFLTPYIIRNHDDFKTIFNRKMAERQEFIERWTAFENRRVDPHLDWSRTNGAVSEIFRVIAEEERDRQLRDKSVISKEVPHTPKEAITVMPQESEKVEKEGRKKELSESS